MIVTTRSEFSDLDAREQNFFAERDVLAKAGLPNDRYPESLQELEIAEKLLSEELDKLSLAEHEQAVFDVHGLPQSRNDDPSNVDDYLKGMEQEIRNIRNKDAYEYAKYLNPDYVTDRSFCLMFLRCDWFDTKLAAQRMVYHFEKKKELFGSGEILGRDVRLSDLCDEAMLALSSGFTQILPKRDAAGRFILYISPVLRPKNVSQICCHRAKWYVINTGMKDLETQRNGIVAIIWNTGEKAQTMDFGVLQEFKLILSSIPKKIAGFHYCFDDASKQPYVTGFRLCLDKEARKRCRIHFGSLETIVFDLQTYGIPMADIPLNMDGSLTWDAHKEWLQIRQMQEKTLHSVRCVTLPRRFDVLFGRGTTTREHTGNLRAAHLVEMFQTEYEQASRTEKTMIAKRIVTMIHESYGRFLRWDEGGWVEVGPEECHKKIGHFFRQLRSRTLETDVSTKVTQQRVPKRHTPPSSPRREETRSWKSSIPLETSR